MRRAISYGLYGAVIAGLVAAPVLWNSIDKSVHLVVDGHGHTVSTTASDVSQVLDAHGYRLDSHDIVAPAAGTTLRNGMTVVLRRGRLLHLSVDGVERTVWTTAPTVQQALQQLGYTTSDFVSVSRSRRLPLTRSDVTIRTPQTVTVVNDGHTQSVSTTDPTVGALLRDLGVSVGASDRLSVPASSAIVANETIRVERVAKKTLTRTQHVRFGVTKVEDAHLARGTNQVRRQGRDGVQRVSYSVIYVDGKEVARTILSKVTVRKATNEIIAVGTESSAKALDVSGPTSPAQNRAIARALLAKRGWSSDYGCLVQMWTRESGWRTNAYNPSGAYGIPQSLPGDKMASAGSNWQTSATTQITWGLNYIAERYGTPCDAWSYWQAHGNY